MILLGLGSNQGSCKSHLATAIAELNTIGQVIKASSVWESKAWGYVSDTLYLNQVVIFETTLSPHELLVATQAIEKRMGRLQKTTDHYEDRVIDIDILAYNNVQQKTDELSIPHPLMCKRNFVLMPLAEIAPHWIHPTLKTSAQELLVQTSDHSIPVKSYN